jgi:signal transduction histidine kinase
MMEIGGGTLTVNACNDLSLDDKQEIRIEIKDTGGGIPPEFMDKLFMPFVSTKGKGRGYGLWRAKTVIEELGGSIQVESVKGTGTTFIIWLPKSSEDVLNVVQ